MKLAELTDLEWLPVRKENTIRMPLGLLGFERIKEYVLLADPAEAPFLWLQVLEDPTLAFLVMPPAAVAPGYQPDISGEDVNYLGLSHPRDALLLNIVTIHGPGRATLNLKGPIVLNRHTLVALQVIPANAGEYSVQYPLPVAAN